jgi:hypothetical protein
MAPDICTLSGPPFERHEGWGSRREIFGRPHGTWTHRPIFPALKRWARLATPLRGSKCSTPPLDGHGREFPRRAARPSRCSKGGRNPSCASCFASRDHVAPLADEYRYAPEFRPSLRDLAASSNFPSAEALGYAGDAPPGLEMRHPPLDGHGREFPRRAGPPFPDFFSCELAPAVTFLARVGETGVRRAGHPNTPRRGIPSTDLTSPPFEKHEGWGSLQEDNPVLFVGSSL